MGVNSTTEITNPVFRDTRRAPIAVISLYMGVKARREREIGEYRGEIG
jgi:hypothetical protein